jgi:hypothetical protein
MAHLWMSLAAVSDVPCEKLGDSTGKLEALYFF